MEDTDQRDSHLQNETLIRNNDKILNLKIQLKEEQAKNAQLKEQLEQLKKESYSSDLITDENNISTNHYDFFNNLSIPAWEEDFEEACIYIHDLKAQGITDLNDYFDQYPEEFTKLLKKVRILNLNNAATLLNRDDQQVSTLHDLPQPISYLSVIQQLYAIQNKEKWLTTDLPLILPNGEKQYYILKWNVVDNVDCYKRVLVSLTNITNRRKTEIALQESEEKFKKAFHLSPTIVTISTVKDGIILETNDSFEQITSWQKDEYLNKSSLEIGLWVNPKDREEYVEILKQEGIVKNKGYALRMKNGEIRNFLVSGHLLDLKNEKVILGVITDITEKKKNEDALKRSEILYKTIFKNTGTATCIIDEDKTLLLGNEKLEELTGYSKEEFENRMKWTEFVSSEDLKRMQRFHETRRENGEKAPKQYEFTLIDRKNRKRHILLTIDLIEGTGMSVASLLDISVRVNALSELKRSYEKYQNLVENINDIFFEIDSNWDFSYLSPSFETLSGYSVNSLIGQPFNDIILPEDLPNINVNFNDLINDQAIPSFEFRLKTKNNNLVWIRNSARLIYDKNQEIIGARGIGINVTEQKETEIQLIKAKEKAEQADYLKSAFLATMSHELRTPLNAIIGFSQLMDENITKSEMIEMATIIFDSGNHLLSIIESIFHLTMLQSNQAPIRIEIFMLHDLYKTLRFYLERELSKKDKNHIEAQFDDCIDQYPKLHIHSDKTKLTQLLTNFLSNAVKYTEHGSITMGCQIDGRDITFYIKDTGIGIKKNQQELIFERFRQIDDTRTRKYGGVGLGLAICKEICELLNGKIWIESEPTKGSSFYFKLPNAIFNRK